MAHLITVLLCAAGIVLFVTIGLAARSAGWGRQYELGIGLVSACLLALKYAWFWLPLSGLEPFLPLHLCNLSELLACLSLLTRWYWFRPVLYFWSLAALIVFVTPELPDGPGTLAYGLFWFSHSLILAVAAYDLIVARFRPRLKDLGVTIVVTLCYLGVVLPVDIILDKNYAYVGPTPPDVPTLIDCLGPWPLHSHMDRPDRGIDLRSCMGSVGHLQSTETGNLTRQSRFQSVQRQVLMRPTNQPFWGTGPDVAAPPWEYLSKAAEEVTMGWGRVFKVPDSTVF